jgi:predicted ester cyclase
MLPSMTDNKKLIESYLQALSGHPKTPALVDKYVSDKELSEHIAKVEAAFPAYEIIAQDIIAEGDKVVLRGLFRGVHRGSFAGIEPTGQLVSAGLMISYRIQNERIVEHWMQFDLFGLLQQLNSAPVGGRS